METLKKIIKIIFMVICSIFFGITSIFLFKKNSNNSNEEAQKKKEETKNELEKKSADDIAADSPNADVISTNITKEQEDFRKRVRDRLNKNI